MIWETVAPSLSNLHHGASTQSSDIHITMKASCYITVSIFIITWFSPQSSDVTREGCTGNAVCLRRKPVSTSTVFSTWWRFSSVRPGECCYRHSTSKVVITASFHICAYTSFKIFFQSCTTLYNFTIGKSFHSLRINQHTAVTISEADIVSRVGLIPLCSLHTVSLCRELTKSSCEISVKDFVIKAWPESP